MIHVATVESLWRYPVKSMAGEQVCEAFFGFHGVFGDRCFAFKDSAGRTGFPYLSATMQERMLLFRPRFRFPERAAKPPNLFEAMAISPGVNPANAEPDDLLIDVETPSGGVVGLDDPSLRDMLVEGLRGEHQLSLVRSDRALTDCRPVSMISVDTVRQLGDEAGAPLDKRRFRANIYLKMDRGEGFAEDQLVGRQVKIGDTASLMVLERDPRCKMISLDPDTGEHDPSVLKRVAKDHGADAGVYCAVLREGMISEGDAVEMLYR